LEIGVEIIMHYLSFLHSKLLRGDRNAEQRFL